MTAAMPKYLTAMSPLEALGVSPGEDLWVFGYGSLMWDPGFPVAERAPALLYGYHRRFCIQSRRYRGTPERPGLVLGLDHGGSCRGIALRAAAADAAHVAAYLWDREMDSYAYRPRRLRARLLGGSAGDRTVTVCTFVVDRTNPQYCQDHDLAHMAERIRCCRGQRGSNADYLINTVQHLDELGINDGPLHRLLALVTAGQSD